MLMTSVFFYFAREEAAIFLPGAAFLVSMLLMFVCLAVFLAPARHKVA